MTAEFIIEQQEIIFQSYLRIDRYRWRIALFEGGWSQPLERELFVRGAAVAVLPYDVVRDEVVLIEQMRIGAVANGWNPLMLECVAGMVEEGETTSDVAQRETMEECGCKIESLHKISEYLASPGCSSEVFTVYCGLVDSSRAGGIYGIAEEGENIRVVRYKTEEALALLDNNRINNAMTIIALSWLARNKEKLVK
ncbi:MAG: NUDIX domain-containing protein [Alphaproteobacteria bacterium]